MNRFYRAALLLGFWACAAMLAGCAKPRTGPFDVPGATTGQGYSSISGGGWSGAAEDVKRAAAELSAAKIYFAFDKFDLSPDARATLDRVGGILKQYPSIRVSVQGHCDERGPMEYNYGLGARRARAAYFYLVRAGVSASQLDMVTYGEDDPVSPGRSESSLARNRRVEFIVLTVCY